MSTPPSAQRSPLAVEVEAGRQYWWCACGMSKQQPFCDGSHKGSAHTPVAFTAERSERVWLCACKQSARAPFCDGSHNRVPAPGVAS
jgi:CDGSH-type Zn-finger protein